MNALGTKIGFVVALVLVIAIILGYSWLNMRRHQRQWLIVVNSLVAPLLAELGLPPATAQPVEKIWGRSLALFSLQVPVTNAIDIERIKEVFTRHGDAKLKLTDVWLRENHLHMDVALLVNMSTRGYVSDLHKL